MSPRARGTWSQTLRTSLQAPKSETASPSAASCAIPIRTSQRPSTTFSSSSGPNFLPPGTRLCTLPSAHASFSASPYLPARSGPVPQPPDEAPLPTCPHVSLPCRLSYPVPVTPSPWSASGPKPSPSFVRRLPCRIRRRLRRSAAGQLPVPAGYSHSFPPPNFSSFQNSPSSFPPSASNSSSPHF